LAAPGKLWVAGEGDHAPELLRKIYGQANATDQLTFSTAEGEQIPADAVAWLVGTR
jgi:hypothetical protein